MGTCFKAVSHDEATVAGGWQEIPGAHGAASTALRTSICNVILQALKVLPLMTLASAVPCLFWWLLSEIPIAFITRLPQIFATYCLSLTPTRLDHELSEGMNLFKMYQKKKGRFYYFSILFFHLGCFSQEIWHALCYAMSISTWISAPEGQRPYYRLKTKQLAHPGGLQLPKERGDKRVFAKQFYLCELLGLWINGHGL